MSVIDLSVAKARLRVFGTHTDADLQQALDGAEQEAMRFMNRTQLPTLPLEYPSSSSSSEEVPSESDPVAPDVVEAVLLLAKASFEATDPDEVTGYRQAAEMKLFPYRAFLGV
ncbi:head-tail connector protein [Lysobacter enzymogenes]|uniref:head-tail connector protein n=1 Tax=Lysobacter enzymogenes TaxID=69 RepID=UPI000894FE6D|nr:head-tail connector protein [Lysobacter enzymogenes]SDW94897.1 Phage gp6-like head-tail connector protein [Lysobacter enzymogenes]